MSSAERLALEGLRELPADTLFSHEVALIERLVEKSSWGPANGVGNGWIADRADTCVLYFSADNEPVTGTRLFRLDPAVGGPAGFEAVVTDGPARIRSGPGLEHPRLIWCDLGLSLTVWPPAEKGWLRASCYGTNGWIHESLVEFDEAETRAAPDLPVIAGGEQATVISGPARIRSGPGQQHPRLAWCATGASLTVFPPAVAGWLPASCYGANGWIYAALVDYDDGPAQPVVAPFPVDDGARPASGQQATVISGPAHIRSGPGPEHPHLRWCGIGWSLTVWPPAQNGWLPASCYGANGWISASLVQYEEAPSQPAQTDPVQVIVSVETQPASGNQATVISGPANIRSGPGAEHPHLRWCGIGWSLTVWPPAQDGWLPASCYGANGWIHESLVQVGAAN